jgi:hypothetical protein
MSFPSLGMVAELIASKIAAAPNKTITLSGDASGSGTSGITATLATVNSNVGTYQGLTVNGKGLVTAAVNESYLTTNQSITVSGDASGSGTTAIAVTLDTVNSNVGTFQGLTVNGKGLTTAAVQLAATTPPVAGANPTGTTSTTGVMMGLAISFTPTSSGRVMIFLSGNLSNTAVATDTVQIVYGTGTAPLNGVAPTGTQLTGVREGTISVGGYFVPVCAVGMVTGLSPGTTYWIDALLATSNASGTATIAKALVHAYEF